MLIKKSNKRYKDYRRYEHIERYNPFSSKKNVKFIKRNRFINFVYNYITTIRRLQWGRRHEVAKIQALRRQLIYLVNSRLLHWINFKTDARVRSTKTNIKILEHIKFRINRYLINKLNMVKTYYKDAILRKELFFQENFPQETLSPHRKRRVLTYVKRLIRPHSKGYVSYSKLKIDLLFIMTSRLKKQEYKVSSITKTKLDNRANTFKNKELAHLLFNNLHMFNSPSEAIEFEKHNKEIIYLNQRKVGSHSVLLPGDMIECDLFNNIYDSKVNLALYICILFITSYKKRKHIYLRKVSVKAIIKSLYAVIRNVLNNGKCIIYNALFSKFYLENIYDRHMLFICLVRLLEINLEVAQSPKKQVLIRY